jgi:aromatic ring-cleaving dioxygenase
LRDTIAGALGVEVGELSNEPKRPHPVPQFRFMFRAAQFENIVPWLMLNRQGLDLLVHPLADNSSEDRLRYAAWLGSPVPLKLNTMCRRTYWAEQYPAPR